LPKGFGVFMDGGFALLFTRYRGFMKISGGYTSIFDPDPDLRQSNRETKHYVCMNPFVTLGINYQKYFEEEERYLMCSLGYESQFYLNQSFLMSSNRQESPYTYHGAFYGRDLSVFGVTGKVKVAF